MPMYTHFVCIHQIRLFRSESIGLHVLANNVADKNKHCVSIRNWLNTHW